MGKIPLKPIFVLVAGILITVVVINRASFKKAESNKMTKIQEVHETELSGWIAYWKETSGLEVVKNHGGSFNSVSPFWFSLDKDYNLKINGQVNKNEILNELKSQGISVYITLSSEIKNDEMGDFLNNTAAVNEFNDKVVDELKKYDVDGLDLDFEEIFKDYKESFSSYILNLSGRLKEEKFKMSVTLHSKTGKNDYKGSEGQDTKYIANIADEIRIMAYDKHGTFSEPGAITPKDWLKEVVEYSKELVPAEKLVIGIPTYGYIWKTENGKVLSADGYQYDDFSEYLTQKAPADYQVKRDLASGEMVYKGSDFEGWLSDYVSVKQKIDIVKDLGVNKFILWQIGGMDVRFFNY